MKNNPLKSSRLFLSVVLVGFFFFFFSSPVLATTIVIDPGHSGKDKTVKDPATGLHDHDYPNDYENEEMFYVALKVKAALQAAGYTVKLTKGDTIATDVTGVNDPKVKQGANLSATLRARADTDKTAALGVSLHDDHDEKRPWNSFAQIYVQNADGKHCRTGENGPQCFTNKDVANKSQQYGKKFETSRTAAEKRAASISPISFNGRAGIDPGNIPQVELYAVIPWVYNEVGAPKGAYLSKTQLDQYVLGVVNGVKASVPSTGSPDQASGGSTTTSCVITKVGAPKGPSPTLPAECSGEGGDGTGTSGKCGTVVKMGEMIAKNLTDHPSRQGDGFDNLTAPVKTTCGKTTATEDQLGQYWCTFMVIDSYKLAGIPIARNPAVISMHAWWRTAKGFKYVDGNNLKDVKPGYAVFLEKPCPSGAQCQHTFLVKKLSSKSNPSGLDANGNGTLTSLESNASLTSKTYPVSGWKLKNTSYPPVGFGGK